VNRNNGRRTTKNNKRQKLHKLLMKSEIRIVLDSQSNQKKGSHFERLVRKVIEAHRYEVSSNVNFTGMEIDLIAKHKDRSNEVLYVECKAKQKVSSSEIRNFSFNVNHRKADFGYFIRTQQFEHHAAGLVSEMQEDERYKNLTFFEPKKIIELLEESGSIKTIELELSDISKRYLIITDGGDYIVFLRSSGLGSLNTGFCIVSAESGEDIEDPKVVDLIRHELPELADLPIYRLRTHLTLDEPIAEQSTSPYDLETISEVQSSDHWYDYLPASTHHFVGRVDIRRQILKFFKDAIEERSDRRLFYLTGKSGWGKSSLISEIRGRTLNRHYRGRFFTLAVDSRSATSANFPALAFEKLIRKAADSRFIKPINSLSFTSTHDLLTSDSVKDILTELKSSGRFLVLIFDQFEDIFRKSGYFRPFYKFLSDVTDLKPNLIVGFSWKSEILIPGDNEAYHYWQQAKDQALCFDIPAFGAAEISGVISQLEKEFPHKAIPKDLKRRITESSQSLPWLTKKLCIHVYRQVSSGVNIDKLSEKNLNIKTLFDSDLETLGSAEMSTLKYISQRGSDGKFLDISQVGKDVDESSVESLRDKRLIVRSGATYTVYWDVFRDFVVTGEVPVLGESYLFRQGATACFEVFKIFIKSGNPLKIENILPDYTREITVTSLSNILLELRNLGALVKTDDSFAIGESFDDHNEDAFIDFVTEKLAKHTACQKLEKLAGERVAHGQVSDVLRQLFQAYSFKDRTWDTYAKNLISWIMLSNHPLKTKVVKPRKGRKAGASIRIATSVQRATPVRHSLNRILNGLEKVRQGTPESARVVSELRHFGLIEQGNSLSSKGTEVLADSNPALALATLGLEDTRISQAFDLVKESPLITANELLHTLPSNYFSAPKISSQLNYSTILLSWLRPLMAV